MSDADIGFVTVFFVAAGIAFGLYKLASMNDGMMLLVLALLVAFVLVLGLSALGAFGSTPGLGY